MRPVLIGNLPILTSFLCPDFMHSFSNTVSSLTIFTLLCHFNILPFIFVPNFSLTRSFVDFEKLNRTIHANLFSPAQYVAVLGSNIHSRLRAYSFLRSMRCLTKGQALLTSFHDLVYAKYEALLRPAAYVCAWHDALISSTDTLIRNARWIPNTFLTSNPAKQFLIRGQITLIHAGLLWRCSKTQKNIFHTLSFSLEAHGPRSDNNELYLLECLSQLYDQGSSHTGVPPTQQ